MKPLPVPESLSFPFVATSPHPAIRVLLAPETGVTAPLGFVAAGVRAGLKESDPAERMDLALLWSEAGPATAAGVFTTNKVQAAPVRLCREMLRISGGHARGVIVNSRNANACTGAQGMEVARRMAAAAAAALGTDSAALLVASTGRIGRQLPVERVEAAAPALAEKLHRAGGTDAARAILTSDTRAKEAAREISLSGGRKIRIGGMAKGAGMINPNMATMLAFLATDAEIAPEHLQPALAAAVGRSFNRISVDGDMSTNDTVLLLANAAAAGPLAPGSDDFALFQSALDDLALDLALQIVADGEGATKIVTVEITGAATDDDARLAAAAVANSLLVKCSWFGGDPNWGRVLDALGYSGAALDEEKVSILYNGRPAAINGMDSGEPLASLKEILRSKTFTVRAELGLGQGTHTVYTTDVTDEYVNFNKSE